MPPERIQWLEQNVVKFRNVDPDDTDFDDLQPLKKLIGDAQIVQLGEQSHGDGTCFQTKIRLIKFLHQEMGFDVISFESGLFDCRRAWQAFHEGEDPLVAARRGVFGIWTGSQQTRELWEYIAQQANSDRPLELAGFDCQFTASASREFLVEDFKKYLQQINVKVPDDKQELFSDQLTGLMAREFVGKKSDFDSTMQLLQAQINAHGGESRETLFWRQNLKSIQAYADYAWQDDSTDRMKDIMKRDAQMAKNLVWQHRQHYPNRKIIVWAASFHIMRNPSGIEVPDGQVDYSDMVQMGHAVHEALGSKVFTVGFTAHEGSAGAFFRPAFGLDEAPMGTLEDLFHQAGVENGWLSLHPSDESGEWLKQKLFSRPLGYGWMKAHWGEHFDAMVFNRTMKPSGRVNEE